MIRCFPTLRCAYVSAPMFNPNTHLAFLSRFIIFPIPSWICFLSLLLPLATKIPSIINLYSSQKNLCTLLSFIIYIYIYILYHSLLSYLFIIIFIYYPLFIYLFYKSINNVDVKTYIYLNIGHGYLNFDIPNIGMKQAHTM